MIQNIIPLHQHAAPTDEAVIYLRVSTKEQATRGGEVEGFSVPAQREACTRKAEQLNAQVVGEFVDAGESARSADRPDLQRMLKYLAEHPVRWVIVHKVDRLARNRADDVAINLAIQQAGATLVSVTENIDETPSGVLLHGIMSSIAEFYSRNLANEVLKGTEQKVRAGGTPTLAPLGYLNVRQMVEGRETRTVIIDAERATLIRWAFETYATGDWSIARLATELEIRGLTQRPTAKRAARPVAPNKLHEILRNRYYIGYVTWRGLEHDGKHEPLVTPAVFEQVQQVLAAHRQSGERSYRRQHYLAGTLYCDRCSSKLIFGVAKGRRGDEYAYWFCLGRHTYKNGCDLPYLPAEKVEAAVVRQWRTEHMDEQTIAGLETNLLADLRGYTTVSEDETARLDQRIHAIKRERYKWADKAMDGSVPGDIAREKQQQLGVQLAQAEEQRVQLCSVQHDHERVIRTALRLLTDCGLAYEQGTDSTRRGYNQAWFDKLFIDARADDTVVVRVERTELLEALRTAQVMRKELTGEVEQVSETDEGHDSWCYRVLSDVRGSKVPCLVELTGLEPVTPALPGRGPVPISP